MTEKEINTIRKFEKWIYENNPSVDFLVQIIELAGAYGNIMSIPNCAKLNNISYNGVKKNREVIKVLGFNMVAN